MSASVERSDAGGDDGSKQLHVLLAKPRGFCAGVDRAMRMLDEALDRFDGPLFARHAIVHNPVVVDDYERRGVTFVEEAGEAPDEAIIVFSAHGVSQAVETEAERRRQRVIDTTCPLVRKVHAEVRHHVAAGRAVLLIGHVGHPEVLGTMGQVPEGQVVLVPDRKTARSVMFDPDRAYGLAMQTTLAVDEAEEIVSVLRGRGMKLIEPSGEDICYATTNRQRAARAIAGRCDAFIVIGGSQSSNSHRLAEVVQAASCPRVTMIARPEELACDWLDDVRTLGITAGASTPETSVQGLLQRIAAQRAICVEEWGEDETVRFNAQLAFARPPAARRVSVPV